MLPLLTIQVVGWNSAKTLPATCQALANISSKEAIIRYIDNSSTDNSAAIVAEILPQTEIIYLPQNRGFAGAHNLGFTRCATPFVLTHDPDVVINWEGLKRLLAVISSNAKIGAIQGKLGRKEGNVLDSAGIVLTKSFNGIDRGSNQPDQGQYNHPAQIIAPTGACGLYRMEALQQVAHSQSEFFDRDFMSYKEDVDLGWRLKRAGWQIQYEPINVGTHARTLGRRGWFNWGLNPRQIYGRLRSPRTRYSFRNWIWMIAKNASNLELLSHSPFIIGRLLVFGCLSCLYPPFFLVWRETWYGLPNMCQKR